jgi:hypothetical protein
MGATGPSGPAGPAGTGAAFVSIFAVSGQALPRNNSIAGGTSRTDTLVEAVIGVACTASVLMVNATAAPAAPFTTTLVRNGANTTLSCTVSAMNVPCTSTSAVAVAAGDRLMFRVDGPFVGALSTTFSTYLRCQ